MNFPPLLSKNCDNSFGRPLHNSVKSLCSDVGGLSFISLLLLAHHLCNSWRRESSQRETWWMTDLLQGTVSYLLLSRFVYNTVFSSIHASFLWAFIEHLQYARLCVRPSWSRVNQTLSPWGHQSPHLLVPLVSHSHSCIHILFFPLLFTISDLLFLCDFLEVLTCYFLFHLSPDLLSILHSQYFSHISPRWNAMMILIVFHTNYNIQFCDMLICLEWEHDSI